MRLSWAALMRLVVSGFKGQQRTTKSEFSSSTSIRSAGSTSSATPRYFAGFPFVPITRIPNAFPNIANPLPIVPSPTIPRVLPLSSSSRARGSLIIGRQCLRRWLSRASGRRREKARMRAIACSLTALALTPAALVRRMPRRFSSSNGNWLIPTPMD